MINPRTIDIDTLLDEQGTALPKGHDIRALGPSDSSDTGADMIGSGAPLDSTSDRHGTGERASAEHASDTEADADVGVDRIVNVDEAGLGGGLDQAEEAQLGVTDEEIEAAVRERLGLDQD
jgi:hypothetical protein